MGHTSLVFTAARWMGSGPLVSAAPENASPFVQAHLPQGMKFENKRSKSVSFVSEHGPRGRGTSKTREAAEAAVMSWAWRWFNSLNQESQNAIHRCATNKRTAGASQAAEGQLRCQTRHVSAGWTKCWEGAESIIGCTGFHLMFFAFSGKNLISYWEWAASA